MGWRATIGGIVVSLLASYGGIAVWTYYNSLYSLKENCRNGFFWQLPCAVRTKKFITESKRNGLSMAQLFSEIGIPKDIVYWTGKRSFACISQRRSSREIDWRCESARWFPEMSHFTSQLSDRPGFFISRRLYEPEGLLCDFGHGCLDLNVIFDRRMKLIDIEQQELW